MAEHGVILIRSVLMSSVLLTSALVGCGPSAADLGAADYAPLPADGWEVSAPAEQGLDPHPIGCVIPSKPTPRMPGPSG